MINLTRNHFKENNELFFGCFNYFFTCCSIATALRYQNIECQIKTNKKSINVNVTTGAKIKPARMTSAKNSKKPITVFVATARERTGA
jgi:hypothetical protein